MNHELKCWPSFFAGLEDGRKPFEVRKDDRGFDIGDGLRIREYLQGRGYTGRFMDFSITAILRDFPGLVDGYCVLGLQRIFVRSDGTAT